MLMSEDCYLWSSAVNIYRKKWLDKYASDYYQLTAYFSTRNVIASTHGSSHLSLYIKHPNGGKYSLV